MTKYKICPLITIDGVSYCLDKECKVRQVVKCPPLAPKI